MNQFIQKTALFLFLAGGIYACYLVSAIYHEKILKQPYKNIQTGQSEYFQESLLFTLFPQLVATTIGHVIMLIQNQQSKLHWRQSIPTSFLININMFTYNQAVILASFPAVVMAKSCSLLSVIIVAVFFSKVKDSKLRLTHQKLLIGLLATFGIILFNFFKRQQKSQVDHSITLFSFGNLFLIISLIGDGFLPDLQAQIKSQYKPTTIDMYTKINKYTFLISFTSSIITGQGFIIYKFLINNQDFASDVFKFSILNAVGQLFIYRMIKEFRQHIPAFVIAFRKCLTVIVNILWFHHSINKEQLIGIGFVFVAVMWQVYSNYKQKQHKQSQSNKQNQMNYSKIDPQSETNIEINVQTIQQSERKLSVDSSQQLLQKIDIK